jgi:periplasmic protein TonB
MASMSSAAPFSSSQGPDQRPTRPPLEDELFQGLVVSNPKPRTTALRFWESAAVHITVIALLVLVPILWPQPDPEHPDYIRALIYNPPPPPPPPLPKGSEVVKETKRAEPTTPDKQARTPDITMPVERPKEQELKPEAKLPEEEQAGSTTGSDFGVPEGMDVGVEGGVVGGVPGGVLGGVIGGTGDGPVMDYDSAPRLIKQTRPQYPQEAFIKKIEGTVTLEILIDAAGRVPRARVLQSVPALDAAALACVKEWIFSPAMKHGRPVSTVATAPVHFRIY